MTTEELLKKLPRSIKKYEVLDLDKDDDEYLIFFLHIIGHDYIWRVAYEYNGKVLYLGIDDNRDYAIFDSENLNTALQNIYDWCVKHKVIQL